MTRVCSIFSQMLQLIPRVEFESVAVDGAGAFEAVRGARNIDAGLQRAYASHPGFLEGEPQQSGRSGQFRGE